MSVNPKIGQRICVKNIYKNVYHIIRHIREEIDAAYLGEWIS